MPAFLPDTTCMVAAVGRWHPRHADALAEMDRRLERGDRMVLAAHAVTETYAVLTRMPRPMRLSSMQAFAVLHENFLVSIPMTTLDPADYADMIGEWARRGVVGGQIYDAIIAACARKAGADTLLTFNERHFVPFAGPDLRIVVPGEASA